MDAPQLPEQRAAALAELVERGIQPRRLLSALEIEQLHARLDLAADEEVSDAQLERAARAKLDSLEQQAWNTFAHFDLDSDGFVVRAELARLTKAGASAEDVAELLESADGDRDGRISYAEFLAWYTDHPQSSSSS